MATLISNPATPFSPLFPSSSNRRPPLPPPSSLPLLPSPPPSPFKPKTPNPSLSSPSLPSPPLLPHTQTPIPQSQFDSFYDDRNRLPPLLVRRLLLLAARRDDLALGRAAHAAVAKTQDGDAHLLNPLISMYLNLRRLPDARKVFDGLPSPDVVSYTSLISAYAKCGRELDAVGLFCRMRQSGVDPNGFTFVAILTDCIRQANPQLGSQVHALVVKTRHCSCVHVANALMGMYVKCGRAGAAAQLFGEMPERDPSSWNAVILGMVHESRYQEAFELFHGMQMDGHHGDQISLSTLLTAAAEGFGLEAGEAIHAYALKTGVELDLSVGNALVGFYSRFGCIEDVTCVFLRMPARDVISWTGMLTAFMEFGLVDSAVEVFNQMPERNCVTYNALLAGFCHNGQGSRGLKYFQQILEDGLEITDFTLTAAVNACAIVSDLKTSQQIHTFVMKVGCEPSAWIEAALLDMCAKCGRMEDAQRIFDRWSHEECFSMAWTSIVCGHARNGQPSEAIFHFHTMLKRDDVMNMDDVALATVFGVCGTLGFSEMGKQMHCLAVKSGVVSSDLAVANAIFSMYAKCGYLVDAVSFFDQMPQHDIVSWNALITAHVLHRQGDGALDVWANMRRLGVNPDNITFVLIISACKHTSSDSTDTCRKLFLSMTKSYKMIPRSEHYAAIVDVFSYWGRFDEAEQLIKSMPFKPDASIWRALLDNCILKSNSSLGRQAMQHLIALEPQCPSTYILISNLYSAAGRWHFSEKLRQEMQGKGLQKHPVQSWIIHENAVHSFYARDRSHPQSKDIYSGLDILILECVKAGYEPDTSFVLHEVEEYQKKHFLFYHSAKLAVMYGLLRTGPGRPVRVMKNIHLCGDCHSFIKYVSSVTGREILLRDTTGFHSFQGGECSCGDHL